MFECSLAGVCSTFVHNKKRYLSKQLRTKVASELVDERKKATLWRIEEATRTMNYGDAEPPTLYNNSVLRKAKQEEADRRLHLKGRDPIVNLQYAKYYTHIGRMHDIGVDPFYCFYWSQEQLLLYKLDHSKDSNSFLTIDTTGGIAHRLQLPNGEKSHYIFLYQCMSISNRGSYPVFQMVSAQHDVGTISHFLTQLKRNGAPTPRIVVSDFSRAILIAVAGIFARTVDLQGYLKICFDIAVRRKIRTLPACYIRIDVSHLIAIVARWKCLKSKPKKVRQFFLRGIGSVYQSSCFEEVETRLTSLITVALSEDVGSSENDNNSLLKSEIHLRSMNEVIKGIVIDEPENNAERMDENDDEDMNESWNKWANSVFEKAEQYASESNGGTNANAFYNPGAAYKIKALMATVPLWTGLMRPYFSRGETIATSSSVESEFSKLKTLIFEGQLPSRVDKFVFKYMEYIDGRLLLEARKITKTTEVSRHDLISTTDTTEIQMDCNEIDSTVKNIRQKIASNNTILFDESQQFIGTTDTMATPNLNSSVSPSQSEHRTEDMDFQISPTGDNCDSINEMENWRGKIKIPHENVSSIKRPVRRKKDCYLDPCPQTGILLITK